jgi:hypothetical protein
MDTTTRSHGEAYASTPDKPKVGGFPAVPTTKMLAIGWLLAPLTHPAAQGRDVTSSPRHPKNVPRRQD